MLPTIRAALALLCFDQQPSADVGTAILPTPKRQSRRGRFTLDEPARKRVRERRGEFRREERPVLGHVLASRFKRRDYPSGVSQTRSISRHGDADYPSADPRDW